MYTIGDKVVYPPHGAGVIEAIDENEITGVCRQYYVLTIEGMKLAVPVETCGKLGVRPIIDKKEISSVLTVLGNKPTSMPANWNRRIKQNKEKINSGEICQVADVVRNLWIRDKERGLSTGEKRMLTKAKSFLISEMSFALDKDTDEVEEMILDALVREAAGARAGGELAAVKV